MQHEPFVSFAQNREDVVLHRALRHITRGRYLDVGANDPVVDSVTKAFYDRGWRGLAVEPVPAYAARHREQREGDVIAEVAATDADVETIDLFSVPGTGLSSLREELTSSHASTGRGTPERISVRARRLTDILDDAGWQDSDIHFMNLDVEGVEDAVLRSLDLDRYRPWVMVIESLAPDTAKPAHDAWESLLTARGYSFTLFDGLSRFYLADEHPELREALSTPANVLDDYLLVGHLEAADAAATLRNDVHNLTAERDRLRTELDAAAEAQQQESTWLKEQADTGSRQLADVRQALTHVEKIKTDLTTHRDDLLHERTAMVQEQTTMRQEREELLARIERLQEQLTEAEASALTWRTKAVSTWADFSAYRETSGPELDAARASEAAARQEIVDIKNSTSWRVTKALRAVGGLRH